MSRRYSRILASPRLVQAANRYADHIKGTLTRPSRVGTQGQRKTTKEVYLKPFTFDIPVDNVLRAFVNPADYTALHGYIDAAAGTEITDALGAKSVQPMPGYKAARVVWFRNSAYSAQAKTADITGLSYLKYNGDRSSCPFGATADADDEGTAFQAIKDDILSAPVNAGLAINRVSLSRERLSY